MPTYLFAWNPAHADPLSLTREVRQLAKRGSVRLNWRSGTRRHLPVGSRAFMIRLGDEPRGIIGAGRTVTEPLGSSPTVEIEFDSLQERPAIPFSVLQRPLLMSAAAR